VWLSLGIVALVLCGACHRGVPAVDVGPKPPDARGTMTGIVRGPGGASAMVGRTVEAINTTTGERRGAKTAADGGFRIVVPPGTYRLELALKDGEAIVKRPGVIDMDKGDIGSHIEFVLGPSRISRPHGPAYRVENGLGAPIA
jgi:carboxypeptidase family protein